MQVAVEQELRGYISRSHAYWRQANDLLARGEGPKAGELAWGSVVAAIHAVALAEGKGLKGNHGKVKGYIRDLSRILQDEEIFRLYQKGEAFHANFYQSYMDKEEVLEHFSDMDRLMKKLLGLIPGVGGNL